MHELLLHPDTASGHAAKLLNFSALKLCHSSYVALLLTWNVYCRERHKINSFGWRRFVIQNCFINYVIK